MKHYLLLLATLFLLIGCTKVAPVQLSMATATAVPTRTTAPVATHTQQPTATATAVPTTAPTLTATPTSEPTATATASPTLLPTPFAPGDGLVYFGELVLLDILEEAPGCYTDIPPYVEYSPTQTHFFLLLACIETDNQAFVFAADGSGKQRITAAWDLVNMEEISWSDDGRTIRYERINSCCLAREDIPEDAPPQGLVEYEIASGEKSLTEP